MTDGGQFCVQCTTATPESAYGGDFVFKLKHLADQGLANPSRGTQLRKRMDGKDQYWARLLLRWRSRDGLTQAQLAELLNVDQTSISRWERCIDSPRVSVRQKIRDAMRTSVGERQDNVTRIRVRQALWPQTLVREGAVFLEASCATLREARVTIRDLRGRSIYGTFGQHTDQITEQWERSGIFTGEIALCSTVNKLPSPDGVSYIRTVDTPYFSSTGEIWCTCDVKRIDEAEYQRLLKDFRGPMLAVPFDSIA